LAQLELQRFIPAPAELVWRFLSTGHGLSAWHADEVKGSLQEGGFLARYPTLGAELKLRVAKAEPYQRITLQAGSSLVDMTLLHGSPAGVTVQLQHSGLDPSDDLDGFRSSWRLALGHLHHAVTAHPEGSRKTRWLFHSAPVVPSLAHYYFTSQLGLQQWLGRSEGDIGPDGTAVSIRLASGLDLNGEVLSHSPGRDLCLEWEELSRGTLTLRTLPGNDSQRQLAIACSTWDRTPPDAAMKALGEALRSLASTLSSRGQS
jgi:uncharacterized protein YndB with AHSA1/START domain